MMDRWGNSIVVGWAAHEILWVEAALQLAPEKHTDAWSDIGEMTGRGAQAVRRMAQEIVARRNLAESIAAAERRAIRFEARRAYVSPILMPTELRQPTKAQLMRGRA